MPGAKIVYVKDECVMERYRCGVTILRPKNGRVTHKYTDYDPEERGWIRVPCRPW